MEYSLKPCPFCGKSVAVLSDVQDCEMCANFESNACPRFTNQKSCPWIFVVCNCSKGGCGTTTGWFRSEEDAIEAWNRRNI